jgi:hypothetical protein
MGKVCVKFLPVLAVPELSWDPIRTVILVPAGMLVEAIAATDSAPSRRRFS